MDVMDNSSVVKLLSDNDRQLFLIIILVILCGVVSAFGCIANVINMIVFYRQGLDTTINISFFSLAVSDLCGLVLQQLYNLFDNPLFVGLNLPINHSDVQFLTTGLPRVTFSRITCYITAFIAIERCLCVVFPLHIKRIITPQKTSTVIVIIYTLTVVSFSPVYFTEYYTWKLYSNSNVPILGLAFTKENDVTQAYTYFSHGFFSLLGFLSVLFFTLILTFKLAQKNAWRKKTKVDLKKTKSMSRRDRATITMVVLIAGILVVCYTPAVLLCLTTFIEPTFARLGHQYNIYISLWAFAFLMENINSSVNIFLYYKMSSKYRQTFIGMFCKRFLTDNKIKNF